MDVVMLQSMGDGTCDREGRHVFVSASGDFHCTSSRSPYYATMLKRATEHFKTISGLAGLFFFNRYSKGKRDTLSETVYFSFQTSETCRKR